MTDVRARWRGANASSAEQSPAPEAQEEFCDGVGEHEGISDLLEDQKDVLLLRARTAFRCETLDFAN